MRALLGTHRLLLLAAIWRVCALQPDVSVEEQVGKEPCKWADALMRGLRQALYVDDAQLPEQPRADRFRGTLAARDFGKMPRLNG